MPLIGRSQTNSGIDQSIRDALERQNTASVVRAVLKMITENYFNRVDDTLAIDQVEGLRELLNEFSGPAGVAWLSAPATPLPTVAAGVVTIPEAAATLEVAGEEMAIAALDLTTAITAEGKRKAVFIMIDVSAEAPLVYKLIEGPEGLETAPLVDPVVPPDHFLVHRVEIGDGTAVVVTGFAKSVNGVFPDSAGNITITTGDPNAVKKVNNILPDASGNVTIQTVDPNAVKKVNGVLPDANGNVQVAVKGLLIGYADDAAGTNASTSPAGKKFRAEYVPADNDPNPATFTPALAAGKWVPFSNNALSGNQAANIVDFNIDLQFRTMAAGSNVLTLDDFRNVRPGAEVTIEVISTNATWALLPGTVTQGAVGSGTWTGTGTSFLTNANTALRLAALDRVRINQYILDVASVSSDTALQTTGGIATGTTGTIEKLSKDQLVLPASIRVSQTAAQAGAAAAVTFRKGFGVFVEGYTNIINIKCLALNKFIVSIIPEFVTV